MGYKHKAIRASRYHDISTGHRVVGHENKCRHLHGHNYRIHFHCQAEALDSVGRVIDFGVIKEKLCMWVEDNWDHKFLHWAEDPLFAAIADMNSSDWDHGFGFEHPMTNDLDDIWHESLVAVPFNPTAENMAQYLVEVVGPQQLAGTGVLLVSVEIEETAKCSASYSLVI